MIVAPAEVGKAATHKVVIGSVDARPIAWISTHVLDAEERASPIPGYGPPVDEHRRRCGRGWRKGYATERAYLASEGTRPGTCGASG